MCGYFKWIGAEFAYVMPEWKGREGAVRTGNESLSPWLPLVPVNFMEGALERVFSLLNLELSGSQTFCAKEAPRELVNSTDLIQWALHQT